VHQEKKSNVERFPILHSTYQSKIAPLVEEEINGTSSALPAKREVEVPNCTIFTTLMRRDFLNILRNPMLFKSRLFQYVFLGVYIGGLFFSAGRQDYNSALHWSAITGFLFENNILNMMSSLTPISVVFPLERAVFLKEENARYYSVLPYFLSRNVIELPFLIAMPMLFVLIFYWMIGLASTPEQFFLFYFVIFLVSLCGNSLGLLLGSIVTDAKSLAAHIPTMLLPVILLSGFFKNSANLPDWIGWIQYISPIKYGFVALTTNETKYKSSRIDLFNFDTTFWESVGLLIVLALSFRFLSLFFLWYLRTRVQ
jgi:ATP-binding cassette, subfamily G (WHITE), eye pigment precursor transporter